MTIQFAEKCAWRGVYVYRGQRQVAHLVLDPTGERGPALWASLLGRRVRLAIPHVRWSLAARSPLALRVYRVQQRLLHGLDGRYGWGTKQS